MIICPDCFVSIDPVKTASCPSCAWTVKLDSGIADMLSSSDRKDSFFRHYVDLYEKIAGSEINAPVNSDTYVESLAKRTVSLLGDINNKKICDIGSGKGFLLREVLKKQPRSVTAVDIATNYLKQFDYENVDRIVANAENLPFENEFEIAVSTDVLEHVLNVGSFMYSVNKILKDGGLFLVRVPYKENLLQYGKQNGSPYPFTHLRTYDVDLLKHQVVQAGFRPVKVAFDGFQSGYPRAFFQSGIGKLIFKKLVFDRYSDYWSVTTIASWLGNTLMRPVEVNLLCRKIQSL